MGAQFYHHCCCPLLGWMVRWVLHCSHHTTPPTPQVWGPQLSLFQHSHVRTGGVEGWVGPWSSQPPLLWPTTIPGHCSCHCVPRPLETTRELPRLC